MIRYRITRGVVVYKGKRFKQGEYLPETFSEKERWRTATPHRIAAVSVEDTNTVSLTETITSNVSTQTQKVSSTKSISNAPVKAISPKPPIGTPSAKS